MRNFRRGVLGLLVLCLLVVGASLIVNATDEELSSEAVAGLALPPAKQGFSLLSKPPKVSKDKTPIFYTYQEYKADPAKWNDILDKNKEALAPYLAAAEAGQVAEGPKYPPYVEGIHVFRTFNYFNMHVSRLIHEGKTSEALQLVERYNHFLTSILSGPHSSIVVVLALNSLRANAGFLQSLIKEGVLQKGSEVKKSLEVSATADEISERAAKGTLYGHLAFFKDMENSFKNSTIKDLFSSKHGALDSLVMEAFYRPHQTANWMTQIHHESLAQHCQLAKPECSETYRQEIESKGFRYYFMNPTGRYFIKEFTPDDSVDIHENIELSLQRLQKLTSEL